MKLIDKKGTVKFFEDDNNKQYQQLKDKKIEPVKNGEMSYRNEKKLETLLLSITLTVYTAIPFGARKNNV